MDILDQINWEGDNYERFKVIMLKCRLEAEQLEATITSCENELETSESELQSLQDQISYSTRNISDAVNSQITSKHSIDHMKQQGSTLQMTELDTKQEIDDYKKSYEELKLLLSKSNEWPAAKLELKQQYESERDELRSELSLVQENLSKVRLHMEDLGKQAVLKDIQLDELMKQIDATDTKIMQANEQKMKIESIFNDKVKREADIKEEISQLTKVMYEKSKLNRAEDTSVIDLESRVTSLKTEMENCVRTYDKLYKQLQSYSSEIEALKLDNTHLEQDIFDRMDYITNRKNEVDSMKKECVHYQKLYELAIEKQAQVEKDKSVQENIKETLIHKMQRVREVEILNTNKQIEAVNLQITSCKNQLQILDKKQLNSDSAITKFSNLIITSSNGKRILEGQLLRCLDEIKHINSELAIIEKEKTNYENDIEHLNSEYYRILEENRLYDIQLKELSKDFKEFSLKLKQKQSVYESIRLERNINSKELLVLNEEINELKQQYKDSNIAIMNFKKEISKKDHTLIKETFYHSGIDKELENFKTDNSKILKQINNTETLLNEQRIEINKCRKVLETLEVEQSRVRNELTNMTLERNVLATHLVKRNFEVKALYIKIQTNYPVLRNAQDDLNEINKQIEGYQKQLVEVVKNHDSTVQNISNLSDLKNQTIQYENIYDQLKIKTKFLNEELTRPLNVHRWRVIQSSDPQKYDKILKIQELQKVLITKTSHITSLMNLITEKEQEYETLKLQLNRRVDEPEIKDAINQYSLVYKEKKNQLSALEEECVNIRNQVKVYNHDIRQLDSEMNRLKKKWLKSMKVNTFSTSQVNALYASMTGGSGAAGAAAYDSSASTVKNNRDEAYNWYMGLGTTANTALTGTAAATTVSTPSSRQQQQLQQGSMTGSGVGQLNGVSGYNDSMTLSGTGTGTFSRERPGTGGASSRRHSKQQQSADYTAAGSQRISSFLPPLQQAAGPESNH